MKAIALGLVVLLVLAFTANEQQKTAAVVTCGQVSGGATIEAKGVDWAEDFGDWIHGLATTPIDSSAVKAAVEGVERVLFYWFRTWFLSSKGLKLDPEILQLQQQAADARAAAESQCTPCPQALPQDSSPLASLGAAPVTGSPEEISRQVAARYWPADELNTAVAISGAESTYNDDPPNAPKGMLGRWQINGPAHPDLVAGKKWRDPSVNAYMAHQIWLDAGKSWSPWTTYTSGSYKRFLKPSAASKLTAAVQPQVQGTLQNSVTSPVNPQNVGCQSSGMPEVRVATWNSYCGPVTGKPCGTGNPATDRVVPAVKKIAAAADVFGLQEMSNSERRRAVADALPDFGIVGGDNSDPIYYRKSMFTLTDSSTPLVFHRTDSYEGPSQGDRHVNTAVLRSTDGKTLTFINMHQLPQIQKSGGLDKSRPKRIKAATDLWAAAFTSARQHVSTGAVVVVGDMNYDGTIPGSQAAGLTSASSVFGDLKQATRTRDIDQILFSAGAPASEKIIGAFGSDHSARVVTFLGSSDTSATAAVAGMRSVTDPTSHKTFQVQIPAGPRGVAINYAIDQLGKRYVWGAHGPNTFDCSGLMSAAWGKAGVTFTPQTESMFREIPHTSSPQPGDIAYHPGHVQMVLNDGLILEAANPRVPVRIIDRNWMKPTAYFDPTKMSGATA